MPILIDIFKKHNPEIYPVSNAQIDYHDETPQDELWKEDDILKCGENTHDAPDTIRNIAPLRSDKNQFSRHNSYFRYFLDGCRRSYYLCDMSTASGTMLPILAGQISSAVLARDCNNGRVSVHKYAKKGLILLPAGGKALNSDDAEEIKKVIDRSFAAEGITAKIIPLRHDEDPKLDALANLNMEMQNLEIEFLETMVGANELSQDSMIIVDGAIQFSRVKEDRISSLRYAIGLSKIFKLHLKGLHAKGKEIGTQLINLKKVGDRTMGFRLKLSSGTQYVFWYLRLRPMERMDFPFAGIVKLEKVLVTDQEKEDGASTDVIDNISKCILIENSVCPYGLDFRWASHIYPIYLTEQIQKKKFTTDFMYKSLLNRKVVIS